MVEEHNPNTDLEALLEQIRQRVEARRKAGEYPAGLEEELEGHFRRIVDTRVQDLSELKERLDSLQNLAFQASRISLDSDRPGGSFFHRAVAKLVSRQVQGALDQVREFSVAIQRALDEFYSVLHEPPAHHALLLGYADSVLERLMRHERRVDSLEKQVLRLEQQLAVQPDTTKGE